MLHTEPSFCVYADEDGLLENEEGDSKVKKDSGDFSFTKTMGLNVEHDDDDRSSGFENLGIVDKEDEQIDDVEKNYKRMVDEDPSNPMFLKNYAHLLQSNGDLNGAEEYYFRATVADPKDGEILMQYAKLIWELHLDQGRALSYFETAARAAPQDSNVLAAYARFLWEIDDDDDDDDEATALVETKGDLGGAEEYYLRAVQADPGDGKVISQYAQLVWELHRDQNKANVYFEQAVEAAPADSHVLAAYAKFLWEAEDDEELQLPAVTSAQV